MTAAPDVPLPSPEASHSRWRDAKTVWTSACGLSLLFFAPLLIVQLLSIWEKEPLWFAFVVMAVVAITALRFTLSSRELTRHSLRWSAAVAGLSAAALCFAFSVWNFSPWLAHLATVVLFFAWALVRWGARAWSSAGALALLLLTSLPWPRNWDFHFDRWLKSLSGNFASDVLDAFQVPNLFAYGLLRTEFFTFETDNLSGWGSVFALIAVAGAIGILRHRSFLQTLLVALATPMVYVVIACLGLLLCSLTASEGSPSPLSQQVAGFQLALFIIQVLMLLLIDQCLALLFRTVPVTDPDFGFIFAFTNKLLHWPQVDPQEAIVPEDPLEREAFEHAQLMAEAKRRKWPEIGFFDWPAIPWTAMVATLLIVGCGSLPAWLLVTGRLLPERSPFRDMSQADLVSFPNETTLPERMGDWQQVSFEAFSEETAQLVWQYGWKGQRIQVILSFPHQGSPLSGLVDDTRLEAGWSQLNTIVVEDNSGKQSLLRSQYANQLGGNIFVLRSTWDADLNLLDFGQQERSENRRRRRSPILDLLDDEERQARQEPSYWLVAEVETGGELSSDELKELQSGFERFREELAKELKQATRLQEFMLSPPE